MPDLVIPDLDQAVIERLEAAAKRRGTTVGRFITGMLDTREAGEDAGVVGEIAAMRASQPRQESDAADDVRHLRDGGDGPQDTTRAA